MTDPTVTTPGRRDDAPAGEAALELHGLSKEFGGVHALLGQNGSGKSTLIKVLAGFHAPDAGALRIDGRDVPLPLRPGGFREHGLAFVHQDLALMPSLSVTENLWAEEVALERRWRISWARARDRARAAFERWGVELDPAATVADIGQIGCALLAIVRALEGLRDNASGHPGILVLDEPTSMLPRADAELLFGVVRRIAAEGASVLLVSHDLDEVLAISDRATILRDGRLVGTVEMQVTEQEQLVELLVGTRLDRWRAPARPPVAAPPAISIAGVRGAIVQDFEAEIAPGEILGLAGLRGSGFEELLYLLVGAVPARAGSIALGGETIQLRQMTPRRAVGSGIALVPANRQEDGAILTLSVTDNVTMPRLPSFRAHGFLRRGAMTADTRSAIDELEIRPGDPGLPLGALSGGNQQKAVMAKWLATEPQLLLLHEPTQGVDVGARQQIFRLIDDARAAGTCVLVASSDHEELATICQRAIVMTRGLPTERLAGEELTKERLAEACLTTPTGGKR